VPHQAHVKNVCIGRRTEVGQKGVGAGERCPLRQNAEADTDSPNVRVHRDSRHSEREQQDACGGLGTHTRQSGEEGVDLVTGHPVETSAVASHGALRREEGAQCLLDAPCFDIRESSVTDRACKFVARCVYHGIPVSIALTEAPHRPTGVHVAGALRQDCRYEGIDRVARGDLWSIDSVQNP